MRRTLIALSGLLLFSCSKQENTASKYLNTGNLKEQLFTIDIHRDTSLTTQQGLKIRIDANSIEASTTTITIQIKEALTLDAMLKAGLTTVSDKGILSSDGMFNFTTKEESTIKKPINISVPTMAANKDMQLYKGKEQDGSIVWEVPKPLIAKPYEDTVGKRLFIQNCSSCHAVDRKLTAPPLAWTDQRFGRGMEGKSIVYDFIDWPSALPADAAVTSHYSVNEYYCKLIKDYKSLMPPFHGVLTHEDYDAIYHYVNQEAKRLNVPETSGEGQAFLDLCQETRAKYHLLLTKKDSLTKDNEQMTTVQILPPLPPSTNIPPFPGNVDTTWAITKVDKVVPDNNTAEYYQFNIEAYGWYNIDVLVAEKDNVQESSLMVRLQMPVTLKADVFMVMPNRKVFVQGGLLKDSSSYGFYTRDGKILLPQGENIYLFAVGESGEKIYFSQTSFVAGLSQTIHLALKETNKTIMINAIAQLRLTDIKVDVKETKNYKGIKAIDKELMELEHKLEDCSCGEAKDTSVSYKELSPVAGN